MPRGSSSAPSWPPAAGRRGITLILSRASRLATAAFAACSGEISLPTSRDNAVKYGRAGRPGRRSAPAKRPGGTRSSCACATTAPASASRSASRPRVFERFYRVDKSHSQCHRRHGPRPVHCEACRPVPQGTHQPRIRRARHRDKRELPEKVRKPNKQKGPRRNRRGPFRAHPGLPQPPSGAGFHPRPDAGSTAGPTSPQPPCRGRRPRRPAVTVSAGLTAFRQPRPGRGMISQYITRHTARLPPAVGVGVLDDPFLRPPPAPRRRAEAAGGGGRPQRGNPRRGFPL